MMALVRHTAIPAYTTPLIVVTVLLVRTMYAKRDQRANSSHGVHSTAATVASITVVHTCVLL